MEQAQETAKAEVKATPKAPAIAQPKKKKKWPKRLLIVVIILAIIALAFYQLTQTASTMVASSYYPQTATVRDMTISVSGTGTISPIDSYQVTAMVSGEILSAPFGEGDIIEKDDLLFLVDSTDVENAIAQQEIALRQAELNYSTTLQSQSDLYENLDIEATGDGIITKVYVDAGDTISAGTLIADIFDRDNMKITLPFHATHAESFYEGQVATVYVDGYSDALSGTVDSIAVVNSVGAGGTLVREVTIILENPGILSNTTTGTASIGLYDCTSSGTFAYGEDTQIWALNSGEILALYIEEGDTVTNGQIVGIFEATDMDNTVESARLSVETAQLSYNTALDSLEDYTITSPISGTIVEMNYKEGDNYDPTSTSNMFAYMAVIYDMSALEFQMSIDELDINSVEVGQRVEFTADAVEGVTFYGTITTININGTTAGGFTTYPATVSVDEDCEGLLPGMNVSAEILIEEVGDVLTIPVEALARGNIVTVADEGALSADGLSIIDISKLREVEVTIGRSDSSYVEITSGLSEGDVVVVQSESSSLMSMMGSGMSVGGLR